MLVLLAYMYMVSGGVLSVQRKENNVQLALESTHSLLQEEPPHLVKEKVKENDDKDFLDWRYETTLTGVHVHVCSVESGAVILVPGNCTTSTTQYAYIPIPEDISPTSSDLHFHSTVTATCRHSTLRSVVSQSY